MSHQIHFGCFCIKNDKYIHKRSRHSLCLNLQGFIFIKLSLLIFLIFNSFSFYTFFLFFLFLNLKRFILDIIFDHCTLLYIEFYSLAPAFDQSVSNASQSTFIYRHGLFTSRSIGPPSYQAISALLKVWIFELLELPLVELRLYSKIVEIFRICTNSSNHLVHSQKMTP